MGVAEELAVEVERAALAERSAAQLELEAERAREPEPAVGLAANRQGNG